jgi:hypothetical protein
MNWEKATLLTERPLKASLKLAKKPAKLIPGQNNYKQKQRESTRISPGCKAFFLRGT